MDKNLSPRQELNPKPNRLSTMLDWLWPVSLQVYYGPNRGDEKYRALGAYVWGCCPCARGCRACARRDDEFVDSDVEARDKATRHARMHLFARAIYDGG